MRRTTCIAAAAAAITAAAGLGLGPASAAASTGWRAVAGPSTPGLSLSDVETVSAHSAWAIGIDYTSDQPTDHGSAVLEHWNGSTWSEATGTVPTADGFTNLSALSDTNIWVSGATDREFGATRVWHYNGTSWTALPSQGLPATIHGRVLAVKGHAWLVGQVDAGLHDAGAVIATFHGAAASGHWTITRLADTGGFYGAAARTANDAWAVGSTSQYTAAGHAVVAHWNGRKWTMARIGSIKGQLTDVAIDSAHNVMAVGLQTSIVGGLQGGLTVQWNGKKWASRHLSCKVKCQLSTVAAGPTGSYWASGHGALESHTSEYVHFSKGKWHAEVNGPDEAVHSGQRRVDVLGLARVPGTAMTLSVGYATSHTDQYSGYKALRESDSS